MIGTRRILFLDQSGELGGAELSLADLAAPLGQRARVALFADGPFAALLRERGVPVMVLPGSPALRSVGRGTRLPGLGAAWGLDRLARRVAALARDADLIHCNTQKAFVIGTLAGRLVHRPVIYHLRDLLTADHFSWINRAVAVRLANRLATRVLANSAATRDAFVAAGGDAHLVEVLYNGIDPAPLRSARPDPGLRERLGCGDVPLFGAFGRLAPWKGQHVLLEALVRVPTAHALLVGAPLFGEDAYAEALQRRAQELGVGDRAHFLGFRSPGEVASLLQTVDGVVHTSVAPEPFGRAIVEGMMAGRPVVATAAGGAAEILRDGETGRLVPPGDAEALTDVLRSWIAAPDEVARLARAGQADALARFALSTMLERFERLVGEVLAVQEASA